MPLLPPGPTSSPVVQLYHLNKDPLGLLDRCYQKYGASFTMRLPRYPPIVFFSDPEDNRAILSARRDDFSHANDALKFLLLGDYSILFLDEERHQAERNLMMPAMHGPRLKSYGNHMCNIADAHINGWPTGTPFRIFDKVQLLTQDVILRCVFGAEKTERIAHIRPLLFQYLNEGTDALLFAAGFVFGGAQIRKFVEQQAQPAGTGLMRWVPRPWGSFARCTASLKALLLEDIRHCRQQDAQSRTDILAMLAHARDESGQQLSEQHLLDELLTLLIAGAETTSIMLSWVFYHLLRNPDVVERIREETEQTFRDAPIDSSRIGELKYLKAAINETMRLNPVANSVARITRRTIQIGAYEIPKGTVVQPSIYLTHRCPKIWPDPERFRPERFLSRSPGQFEFYPFSVGVRRCLGMAFAEYQLRIVVAQALRRVTLRLISSRPVRGIWRGFNIFPDGGIPVILEKRRPSPRWAEPAIQA